MPIESGTEAPPIPGADRTGPTAVFFYKVTCPTCQLAAPVAERLHAAFPGRLVAVAQDPPPGVGEFAKAYGTTFDSVSDQPPYPISEAYGVRTVPTLFLVEGGRVAEVVESWDREGWNAFAEHLAGATGGSTEPLSTEGDGLPAFKPG